MDGKFDIQNIESSRNQLRRFDQNDIIKLVKIIHPPKEPLTLERITKEVNNQWNKSFKKRDVKLVLKEKLNYWFKKGSSTTIVGGSTKIKILQSIFSSRILLALYKERYFVNIDEASI